MLSPARGETKAIQGNVVAKQGGKICRDQATRRGQVGSLDRTYEEWLISKKAVGSRKSDRRQRRRLSEGFGNHGTAPYRLPSTVCCVGQFSKGAMGLFRNILSAYSKLTAHLTASNCAKVFS